MGNAITSVKDYAGSPTRSVERKDGLYAGEKSGDIEGFEEYLGCCVAIRTRIQRWFGKKNRMLARSCQPVGQQVPIACLSKAPHQRLGTRCRQPYLLAHSFQLLLVHPLPYPLHIIPVCDNTMLQRILNFE